MTHKIFISQSERNLGRARAIRRLDAILDSQPRVNVATSTGIHLCDYVSICPVTCTKKPLDYCAMRRFYEKYKQFENGRYLGI